MIRVSEEETEESKEKWQKVDREDKGWESYKHREQPQETWCGSMMNMMTILNEPWAVVPGLILLMHHLIKELIDKTKSKK